jgi:hypothetical protein
VGIFFNKKSLYFSLNKMIHKNIIKINFYCNLKIKIYFYNKITSLTDSKGPGFGGGITSGIFTTISGLIKVLPSSTILYLSLLATP